jgi:hypothetical protein
MNAGDTSYWPSYATHFNLPRIAPLFCDLNPGSSGTVFWNQLADRVAVTYRNVPDWRSSQANSFQIELFFSGVIRVTYLGLNAPGALVGLSAGAGQPPGFFASDFTRYAACAAPSVLVQPASRTVFVGGAANFAVGAGGSAPLSYSWRRNAAPIAGANGTNYIFANARLADSGAQFSCLVSNLFGTNVSSSAVLTVRTNVVLANVTFDSGGHLQFTIPGLPGDVYQVQSSTNLQSWQTISNLTNVSGSVLFIDPATTDDHQRFFRCLMP